LNGKNTVIQTERATARTDKITEEESSLVALTSNPSAREAETRVSHVQDQPARLQVRPFSKETRERERE
jgi:hypothetical protein